MTAATWGLLVATFVACFVEMVEATTIVMAMGLTRSWKSAMAGTGTAIAALASVTSVAGYALTTWLPRSALQLTIGALLSLLHKGVVDHFDHRMCHPFGLCSAHLVARSPLNPFVQQALLLIFGLQWLRKAILRSAGRKAVHDEDHIYGEQVAAARAASPAAGGLDMFSFMVSFKGVFLEGIEVVFIVITFGANAHDIPVAVVGAAGAVIIVLAIAAAARRPLSMIPENLLKYGVGLLLASFGTFWAVEGAGIFRAGHTSLQWPGDEAAILGLLAAWLLLSRIFVSLLGGRPPVSPAREEVTT